MYKFRLDSMSKFAVLLVFDWFMLTSFLSDTLVIWTLWPFGHGTMACRGTTARRRACDVLRDAHRSSSLGDQETNQTKYPSRANDFIWYLSDDDVTMY